MDTIANVNSIIPVVAVCVGSLLYCVYVIFHKPAFLSITAHKATAWGFTFWLMWWPTLIISYYLIPEYSTDQFPFVLWVLNVGDLCLLAFVIIYTGGDDNFRWRRLAPLVIALLVFSLHYCLHFMLVIRGGHASPFWSLVLISPSAVLANVAMFAMGWAFLVRWGLGGLLFFIISALYSIVQVPAYVNAFFIKPHFSLVFDHLHSELNSVFYILAGVKVFLLAFPLSYFFSTREGNPVMKEQRYWPALDAIEGEAPPEINPRIKSALLWMLPTVGAAILTAIIAALFEPVRQWFIQALS